MTRWETFIGDVRHALRQFWTARVFTATAVLTLALGIGGTTAIFTLIHAVMLRSLPVSDPARLYRIGDGDNCCVQGGPQDRWGMFSYPAVRAPEGRPAGVRGADGLPGRPGPRQRAPAGRRRRAAAAAIRATSPATTSRRSACRAFGGRVFTPADDTRGGRRRSSCMSHHAWQGTYGGDPKIVGATLVVEGHPFTVVGVTPPGFFGETLRGDPPDLWVPLQQEPLIAGETSLLRQPIVGVAARDRPAAAGRDHRRHGAAADRHPAPVDAARLRLPGQLDARRDPGCCRSRSIAVVPAGAGVGVMSEQYGRSLRILLGVCALVLLIACANVANLLLARAVARRGQTAVRLALGASRRQIVTQALVESVLLAVGGGIVGLVVAVGTARLLLSLAFAGATFLPIDTMPSPLVLAFAFGLALADRHALRRRAGVVRDAHQPDRRAARRRPQHRRSLVVHAQGAGRAAGRAVGGARRRLAAAGAQPRPTSRARTSASRSRAACWCS